jgi:hypothetical protein
MVAVDARAEDSQLPGQPGSAAKESITRTRRGKFSDIEAHITILRRRRRA